MSGPIYIFAGGGTGGHLYPGLAVAEELSRLSPAARIVFACSSRPIDRRILDPLPQAVVPQAVRPLPRGPIQLVRFVRAWRRSSRLARELIGDLRPAAALGLGGFAAGPVLRRAAKVGVPAGLLNPDAVPGKANRYLAKRVDVIFTQFGATRDTFAPPSGAKVRHVGCPIRSSVLVGRREEAAEHLGLRPDRKTLLVFGGSALARSINLAVAGLAEDLSPLGGAWQVLHFAPADQGAEARGGFERAGVHYRTVPYCGRLDLAYAAADLGVCRAGASTVAELAATATPAVLMPYPYHADRHQYLNAAGLADAGAAVICDDAKDASANTAALREVLIPLMGDEGRLRHMQAAAGRVAKPQAAREVAEWLAGSAGG